MEVDLEPVEHLAKNIRDSCVHLRSVSLILLECFNNKTCSPKDVQFAKVRDSITLNALLYREKVLPISNTVVDNVRDFFENYTCLEYNEWVECFDDILQDAQKYHEQALFVKDVHMSVLTDFKEIEISAVNEISVLNVTASSLDDKRNDCVNTMAKYMRIRDWLSFVPLVNVAAHLYLTPKVISLHQEEIACRRGIEVAVATAKAIEGNLLEALRGVIKCISTYASFFSLICSDLVAIKNNEEKKKLHYKKMVVKARVIKMATDAYIMSIPLIQTDLDVLPHLAEYEGFASEWLSNMKKRFDTYPLFKKERKEKD